MGAVAWPQCLFRHQYPSAVTTCSIPDARSSECKKQNKKKEGENKKKTQKPKSKKAIKYFPFLSINFS
jgi:hypothetical protein